MLYPRTRFERTRRRRRRSIIATFAGVLALSVSLPALASADVVNDLINGIGLGGDSSGDSSGDSNLTPQAGSPPSYTPPLHGDNPHGQGTVGSVDIAPSNDLPLQEDPADNGEEIVVGSSRGEQEADGSYHGQITVLSVLGIGILQVETQEGEEAHGPLNPVQTGVLDAICTGLSQPAGCVTVLKMDSETTSDGSTNTYETLGINLPGVAQLSVAGSKGNISDDGTCQTAYGESHVATANVFDSISAAALNSSSTSTACNDGTPDEQENSSQVLNLQGEGLGVPVAGCANGTPNSNFTPLNPLLSAVCNADDSNGSQAEAPYGVREALTVFALAVGDTPLVKVTTAGSESHAVAPPRADGPPTPPTPPTTPTTPISDGGPSDGGPGGGSGDDDGGPGDGGGGAGEPTAAEARGGPSGLAFTGFDALIIAFIGASLIGAGVALRRFGTSLAG